MPTVNISALAAQAKYLQNNSEKSETEAIKEVIENAGINEEFAAEHNVEQAITDFMSRDTEQEQQQAEDQLKQQAANGYQSEILTEADGTTGTTEADLQDTETDL
jgi:hypothetical protein